MRAPAAAVASAILPLLFLVRASLGASSEPAPAPSPSGAASSLEVESDRLDLDLKTMHALLEGHVRLTRGELAMRCARLDVFYAGTEASLRIARARGTGSVEVSFRGAKAESPAVEFDVEAQKLSLEGPVRVLRAGAWATASSAEIDLLAGRIALTGVKASLPIGSTSAARKP